MKYKIFTLLFLLMSIGVFANNVTEKGGYHIEVTAPFGTDSMAYLVQYWNGQMYAVDSVLLQKGGKGVFSSPNVLTDGQYMLYVKPDIQLDLLITEKEQQNIKIFLNKDDFEASTVSGSKDSELLWKYLYAFNKEQDQSKADLLTKTAIEKNKGSWFSAFIKGMQRIQVPNREPKTSAESVENRNYLMTHIFDNLDLQDPRMWRTNYFTPYLDEYLEHVVYPHPDSLAVAADKLVTEAKGNEACFKDMLSHLVNQSTHSKTMGMENVWTKLYENHILDKNLNWIDSAQISDLRRDYELVKNNRIGLTAQNITLTDINGKPVDTNGTDSEFTLLYFYSPDCGYCIQETPRLYTELYEKYKDKGLVVFAIDTEQDVERWKQFVEKNKMTGWINAHDPGYKSNYWMHYDISGIPSVFLLDKDKKIIARKLDLASLKSIFERFFPEKQ